MSDDATPAPDDVSDDGTGTPDAPVERAFTQADVDRIVKDRLARQKSQFADYDDLKSKADRLAEIEAANQSELERAQARLVELEKQASEATARARDASLRSAVVAEAARKNVVDPDAAYALLDRSSLEIGDDGSVSNVAEAMESLLQAKPYLVGGTQTRGSADLGARGSSVPQISRDDLKSMSPAEIVQAQNEGRLNHLFGGSK